MSTAGWRVPINVKLLLILAVPVLGYLVIATTAVLQAQQAADQIANQASLVKAAVGPISLTTSLIDERTITGLEAAGLQDELTLRIGNSTEARRATDEQLAALQDLIADNSEAREAYEPAFQDVARGLQDLRADVDSSLEGQEALFDRYDTYIHNLMDANASAVDRVDDAEFWQGAMLSELATRQKDARAVLIDALIPVSVNEAGLTDTRQAADIGWALGAYENRDKAIKELATGPYARAGSVLIEAVSAADLAELARNTLDTGILDRAQLIDVASYKGGFVYDIPTGDYIHDYFRASVVEILEENASIRTANAARAVRTHLYAGTAGLLATAVIAWVVSRSITRPLRSLTEQAMDTARHRLPETVHHILETPLGEDVSWPQMEPITVATRDEVADVADAFNTMQRSALDLAVEEAILRRLIADSLVTLGQRNQNLLQRQLAFITDLEQDEANPETLGNLFYLDHLAVRMRRNAESLLVLAGIDPPRTWLGPTPIADIVRAALGEAEEYKRVIVRDVDPATIVGWATAELSHLLAELIENALSFSRRGERVEVDGYHRVAPDGRSVGYTVTVKDFGVGMSPDDLTQANRRLAGEESYTIAPSKYMGHYVTGQLAARHGITVQLDNNFPGRGVTATIDIPGRLLTEAAPESRAPLPPLPTVVPEAAAAVPDWDAPTEPETPAVDDFSEPVPLPRAIGEVPTDPDTPAVDFSEPVPPPRAGAAGSPAGGAAPRPPKKRKKRPMTASQLPVPPSPDDPLVIQPHEMPTDPGQADSGQAS